MKESHLKELFEYCLKVGPNDCYYKECIDIIAASKHAETLKHGQVIIDSKDAQYNYYFALKIKNADIQGHGQAVIDSLDVQYCYYFARDIKGADIKKLRNIVIKSKDAEFNYKFAKTIPSTEAEIEKHSRTVLASKDVLFNELFAKNIPNNNNHLHESVRSAKNGRKSVDLYPETKKVRELAMKRKLINKIISEIKLSHLNVEKSNKNSVKTLDKQK